MIKRRGLPPVFWALFGLLVVAGFGLALGNRETDSKPSVSNFDSSGVSALFLLLQRAGYKVIVDQASKPHLGPHDVAICLRQVETKAAQREETVDGEGEKEAFKTNLTKFLDSGGRAVVFAFDQDFADASHQVIVDGPVVVKNKIVNRTLKVMAESMEVSPESLPIEDPSRTAASIWTIKDSPLVWASKVGKGKVVVCNSAIPTSNRFIDKADDAEFVLSTIDLVARPGDQLVFTEASFGNISEPGFFETLGTWAVSAWQQAVILFLVLIFSLGKRFGYPEERRRVVQSSRDLADAFGNLLHRSRRVDLTLQTALARIDQRLRIYLRIPRDASDGERDRLLPEPILKALARLELARADERTRADDALKLIQATDREIDAYLFSVTHQRSA